jgi:hypothetical protein
LKALSYGIGGKVSKNLPRTASGQPSRRLKGRKLLKQKADFLKLLFAGHRLTRREGYEVLNNTLSAFTITEITKHG